MKIKKIILFFTLLYICLYLPLSYTIYSKSWYDINYEKQNTYDSLDKNITQNSTTNLINYFFHRENLNENWNQKEKRHFNDVRIIYDILFFIFVISILIQIKYFDKNLIKKFSLINIFIIPLILIIIPFFSFFWNKIFHNIMFRNRDWILTQNDLSYYLFPHNFFINSIILIIFISVFINIIIYSILIIKKNYTKNRIKN